MINCAEKLVDRLPRFRQIDASRRQAAEDTRNQPPDNIRSDAEKLAAWRQEKQRACDVAQDLYTRIWKAIGRFQDKVYLKFGELSYLCCEGEGAGYKVLTDLESQALQSEMFLRDEIGLGDSLSSTLRALRTAIRLINEASQDPSGHPLASLTAGSENPRGPIPEGPVENARPVASLKAGSETPQVPIPEPPVENAREARPRSRPLRKEILNWAEKNGLEGYEQIVRGLQMRGLKISKGTLKSLINGYGRHGAKTDRRIRELIGLPESDDPEHTSQRPLV